MKKLIVVFMMVIGAVSYSRDYEYMEKKEPMDTREEGYNGDMEKMGRVAFSYWNLEEDEPEKENLSGNQEFIKLEVR